MSLRYAGKLLLVTLMSRNETDCYIFRPSTTVEFGIEIVSLENVFLNPQRSKSTVLVLDKISSGTSHSLARPRLLAHLRPIAANSTTNLTQRVNAFSSPELNLSKPIKPVHGINLSGTIEHPIARSPILNAKEDSHSIEETHTSVLETRLEEEYSGRRSQSYLSGLLLSPQYGGRGGEVGKEGFVFLNLEKGTVREYKNSSFRSLGS